MTLPSEFVVGIAALLESLRIPYHVGGSIASSAYGTYRMTADVDFVIDVDTAALARLADALAPEFYVSATAMTEALAHRSTFNAIHLDTSFKVDFFIRGVRPYDIEEFRRRVPQTLDSLSSRQVMMMSPEDTVLRKLDWFRAGGGVSEQQWRDVVAVLKAMGSRLDHEYLQHWGAELGVSDLLQRAKEQAGGE